LVVPSGVLRLLLVVIGFVLVYEALQSVRP